LYYFINQLFMFQEI